jgi:hypothetical protein
MSRHEESRIALSAAVQIVTEENVSGTAYRGDRRLRAMKTKRRQQAAPSPLIATDPRLVVRTGVVEPEAWPPLT